MDPPSPLRAMQRKLQQKIARLNARHRLLFKHQCMHGNDGVAHRLELLAWEARQVRSSLMRLKRLQHSDLQNQPHGQHLLSQCTINIVGNVQLHTASPTRALGTRPELIT